MRRKIKLGIDVDGVVGDIIGALAPYVDIQFRYKLRNIKDYGLKEIGLDDKSLFKILQSFERTFGYITMKPILGAVEGVNRLHRMGHEINFITARDQYKRVHTDTALWLYMNHFPFDNLFTGQHEKLPIARKLDLEVMVDDNPKHITEMRGTDIHTIIYDASYNKDVEEGGNVVRCKDWKAIVKCIGRLK